MDTLREMETHGGAGGQVSGQPKALGTTYNRADKVSNEKEPFLYRKRQARIPCAINSN